MVGVPYLPLSLSLSCSLSSAYSNIWRSRKKGKNRKCHTGQWRSPPGSTFRKTVIGLCVRVPPQKTVPIILRVVLVWGFFEAPVFLVYGGRSQCPPVLPCYCFSVFVCLFAQVIGEHCSLWQGHCFLHLPNCVLHLRHLLLGRLSFLTRGLYLLEFNLEFDLQSLY